ncbi:MAG: hypothetical protein NXI18_13590 [Alphaproteobacteria bacterium]|nr:hypothetical protein [Alphaproteobacteria bacterium]
MSQISFKVVNGDLNNTIYAPTSDKTVNNLSVEISSDADLTLKAGQPMEESEAGMGTGTLFYLHLDPLNLTATELAALSVTADGWTTKVYSDTASVCMTPTHDTTLSSGNLLTFKIAGFADKSSSIGSTAQLYMDFYRAAPVSHGLLPYTYNSIVSVQAPPADKLNLHNALSAQLVKKTVVQSLSDYPTVRNRLTLVFAPGSEPTNIKAGPETTFTVNFVYASDSFGYGALSTVGQAFDFVPAAGQGGHNWLITPPTIGAQNPGWQLQPQNGQPILGTLDSVEFDFSNIVTSFEPGTTLMVVSYTKVPGYEDGSFTLIIEKEAHVYVNSLDATPNPVVLDSGQASVDLTWTASDSRLTLMPGSVDVTGLTSTSVRVTEDTIFTLSAQGDSAENYAARDVDVVILPRINSMTATPKYIAAKDFPQTVLMEWSVDTSGSVILSSSASSVTSTHRATTTYAASVNGPQMFSIQPKTNDTGLLIQRNEVISAFELQKHSARVSITPSAMAVSPTDNLCALLQSGSEKVTLLDTITNSPYDLSVTAGSGPVAIAFSGDGTRMFVANGDGSSLSVFSVAVNASTNDYKVTKITDVTLSGAPVALDVSDDSRSIFVVSNTDNADPGLLEVVTTSDGQSYSVANSLPFAGTVTAVAASSSAAQAYILSSSAKTIYVVGYEQVTNTYQQVREIGGFSGSDTPVDLALAGQNFGTLLIPCSGSDIVYAIDKSVGSVAGHQTLTTGNGPSSIVVVQSGAYAYVANTGSSSLTMISCFKGYGLCAVVEGDLQDNGAPTALAADSSGSVLYIGIEGGLDVWTAATLGFNGLHTSAGVATSVAASTTQAVSWHNYLVEFNGGESPTAGLWVYDVATQASGHVNTDTKYTSFAFWPDESLDLAIATEHDSDGLVVLDTQGFTTTATVSLSTSGDVFATAISKFGNVAFVLIRDSSNAVHLSVVTRDPTSGDFSETDNVALFTQSASTRLSMATVSDGKKVFVTDSAGKKLYVVTKGNGGAYTLSGTSYDFPYSPLAMVGSPNDDRLYAWLSEASTAAFAHFDIATSTLETVLLPGSSNLLFLGMTVAPDGSRIYVSDTNLGGVRAFSTDSMQNVETLVMHGASFPWGIAISPDGSAVYTANAMSRNIAVATQLPAHHGGGGYRSLGGRSQPEPGIEADASSYSGIFLRDYIGETPTSNTGSGWSLSPDIVPYGTSVMSDPSVLGQQANYGTDYAGNITLDQENNVYIRGLNTNSGAQSSRVYVYWAVPSIFLTPSSWSPYNFSFQQSLQNWLDISAQTNNQIAYTPAPLSWKPSSANPHYCLIAWVNNDANPTPPNLSNYATFANWSDVGNFITSHPNIAWRNTNDVNAPTAFLNAQTNVSGPSGGGNAIIGVILSSEVVRTGGTIAFTCVSPNGSLSVNSGNVTIGSTNTVSQAFDWPADAGTSATLTYTYSLPGGTNLAGGMKVTGYTAFMPGGTLLRTLYLRAPHLLFRPDDLGENDTTYMITGTVAFRYTGS